MKDTMKVITPTGAAQREAWRSGNVAPPEQVAQDLWAVALPIPGGYMASSFGYAVLSAEGVHIIDPGWDAVETQDAWTAFLASQGRSLNDIVTIVITHSHPDHLGFANQLRTLSGAELIMGRQESVVLNGKSMADVRDAEHNLAQLERWGTPNDVQTGLLQQVNLDEHSRAVGPDQEIDDGDELRLGAHTFTAILTPGHTSGHLCFVNRAAGVIITGDHVLPEITPGLGLGSLGESDPLTDYLASLREMKNYDDLEVLPGHEYRFRGLATRSEQIAAHHLKRTRAVSELKDQLGDAPVWEYAKRLPWSRGWENLSGFMLLSALTQTELHLTSVRNGRADTWLDGAWPRSH